jgi:hypothetical protein
MKTLPLLALIFLSAVVSSCHYNPGSGEIAETGAIVPLAAYNTWVYDRVDYAKNGTSSQSIDSITIPNDLTFTFGTGATITWYPWKDRTGIIRSANLTDPNFPGLWRVGSDLTTRALWYKYPAKVGESFRWGPLSTNLPYPTPAKTDSVITLKANSEDMVVIAKNLSITVPAGTFSCYKYESDYKLNGKTYLQVIEYLAPNIGKIKEEQYALDYGSASLRLISHSQLTSKKIGY